MKKAGAGAERLHSSYTFDLLSSPTAAVSKIDQVSPMVALNNSLKKEAEGKPNLLLRYGINLAKGKDLEDKDKNLK